MSKIYLAYGSNLNMKQMAVRCPGATPIGVALINDYGLLFRGSQTGSYLTIEPKKGMQVYCGAWVVSANHEKSLDIYEGFPNFYIKREMEVKVRMFDKISAEIDVDRKLGKKTKTMKAFFYTMRMDRPLGVPTSHYVRTCIDGCADFGIPSYPILFAYNQSVINLKGAV